MPARKAVAQSGAIRPRKVDDLTYVSPRDGAVVLPDLPDSLSRSVMRQVRLYINSPVSQVWSETEWQQVPRLAGLLQAVEDKPSSVGLNTELRRMVTSLALNSEGLRRRGIVVLAEGELGPSVAGQSTPEQLAQRTATKVLSDEEWEQWATYCREINGHEPATGSRRFGHIDPDKEFPDPRLIWQVDGMYKAVDYDSYPPF